MSRECAAAIDARPPCELTDARPAEPRWALMNETSAAAGVADDASTSSETTTRPRQRLTRECCCEPDGVLGVRTDVREERRFMMCERVVDVVSRRAPARRPSGDADPPSCARVSGAP